MTTSAPKVDITMKAAKVRPASGGLYHCYIKFRELGLRGFGIWRLGILGLGVLGYEFGDLGLRKAGFSGGWIFGL